MFLSPYRVVDLTDALGFLTGRILADLGADVIKVEPPGGDPERQWTPFVETVDGGRMSLLWAALNANKRSITLDLESEAGRETLRAIVRNADFVIESFAPGYLARRGLDFERLRADNPGLIMVSISPFGQQAPYRDLRASDLEIMAMSGAMSLCGEPGGEPMRVTLPQAPSWAGAEAAFGAMTALIHRGITGRGQYVDVSAQSAVLAALAHAPVFWDMLQENPTRAGIYMTGRSVTGARMRVFWPCRDGWINFIIYGGAAGRHTNQQLVSWMTDTGHAPDWLRAIDWSTFTVPTLTQEEVERLEGPIGDFFKAMTKQEFYEGALRRQMLGYPVFTVADIRADRQLEARRFWQDIDVPALGRTITYPGSFGVINGGRPPIRRPPARPGEHNADVGALAGSRDRNTAGTS